MTLQDLEARSAGVSADPASYQDQQLGMVVCQEALVAARRGNYGVGAVLVNPQGTIVALEVTPGRGPRENSKPLLRDLH